MSNNGGELNRLSERDDAYQDLDLAELLAVLWAGRGIIAVITSIAASLSVAVALWLPNIYTSTALLAPAESSGGGLSSMMKQYSGLASLAGVTLPGGEEASRAQLGMELLQSRVFIGAFVQRHDILPELMAVEAWDLQTNKIEFDSEIYLEESKVWVRDVKPPFEPKPSLLEAHEAFLDILSISQDKKTGYVTVAVEHKSPVVAAQWVNWLVKDVNEAVKSQDVDEATKSVEYLKQQVEDTSLAELQEMFFELIQSQMETITLTKVRPEYVFKTIDPAVVPEEKSSPRRAVICILGTLFGGILSALFVVIRQFFSQPIRQ